MSSTILSPNSPIDQPFDQYWDKPMTRREAQVLFRKLASNDSELMGMADTASILLNFLCEKLGVQRADVQAYVDVKTEQLKAMREKMKAEAEAANNAQSNS